MIRPANGAMRKLPHMTSGRIASLAVSVTSRSRPPATSDDRRQPAATSIATASPPAMSLIVTSRLSAVLPAGLDGDAPLHPPLPHADQLIDEIRNDTGVVGDDLDPVGNLQRRLAADPYR